MLSKINVKSTQYTDCIYALDLIESHSIPDCIVGVVKKNKKN